MRIAKILPNPLSEGAGDMKQWFHTRCIFDKLSRARATTKKIESTDDLEGWDELEEEHKPEVLKFIAGNLDSCKKFSWNALSCLLDFSPNLAVRCCDTAHVLYYQIILNWRFLSMVCFHAMPSINFFLYFSVCTYCQCCIFLSK